MFPNLEKGKWLFAVMVAKMRVKLEASACRSVDCRVLRVFGCCGSSGCGRESVASVVVVVVVHLSGDLWRVTSGEWRLSNERSSSGSQGRRGRGQGRGKGGEVRWGEERRSRRRRGRRGRRGRMVDAGYRESRAPAHSPKSSPRGARSPLVSRQDSSGTLKTTISLGKNPSILHSGPFYLMKEPPGKYHHHHHHHQLKSFH